MSFTVKFKSLQFYIISFKEVKPKIQAPLLAGAKASSTSAIEVQPLFDLLISSARIAFK